MDIKKAYQTDELSFELSVIRQGFDDILECARKYTYYVTDKRTPVVYDLLGSRYHWEHELIAAIKKEIKSCKNVLPLLGCVVNSSTGFIEEFITKMSKLYPDFVVTFKDELEYLVEESKVN